jgi:hypothetical protein
VQSVSASYDTVYHQSISETSEKSTSKGMLYVLHATPCIGINERGGGAARGGMLVVELLYVS